MKKFVFLCLAVTFLTAWTTDLRPVKVSEDIQMEMPSAFYLMTEDEMATVVFTYRKPFAMYKDVAENGALLSINESVSRWPEADLPIMRSFCRATLRSLHTSVEFIKDDIVEIKGRKYIVFEFTSVIEEATDSSMPTPTVVAPAPPVRKYNYIQYAVVGEKVWVFNFSCPLSRMDEWKETAGLMMGSIEMK